MITIGNNGQEIVDTNYWDSDHAQKGFCYLSWNAGAGRLLVPDSWLNFITEMKTADMVIVSRGQWAEHNREAIELLFEDHTNSPFSMCLVTDQTDRLLPDTDQGGGFIITVWTQNGKVLTLPGKYREVDKLPCLEPWSEQ